MIVNKEVANRLFISGANVGIAFKTLDSDGLLWWNKAEFREAPDLDGLLKKYYSSELAKGYEFEFHSEAVSSKVWLRGIDAPVLTSAKYENSY